MTATIRREQLLLAAALLLIAACGTEPASRPSTAAHNVQVLPRLIDMPELQRSRQLRVYLPPGYDNSDRRYPVMYMHDGQNLFDDATSYVGEWGVDETLNKLAEDDGLELIVVGIDHGGDRRMNELSPWPNPRFGAAEGARYLRFVVDVVKPYIDQSYRTLSDQPHTAIMGSSMGGLISHVAIFEYPQVFSKAGIFSPSYWFADPVFEFSEPGKLADNARLYLLIGSAEGDAVQDMQRMHAQLIEAGLSRERIAAKVVPGEHNEALWRAYFAEAVQWLYR